MAALAKLAVMERMTRTAADLASNSRLLIEAVKICYQAKDFAALTDHVVSMAKKRALMKQVKTTHKGRQSYD
jgi:26S proteasome regulatory subunit N5